MKHFGGEGLLNGVGAVFYLIICLFCPSVVAYFVWSAVYVASLWLLNRSWEKTIIYCFWPLQAYNVGQLYVFQIIKPSELMHPLYPNGQVVNFKLTPLVALAVAIIATWIIRLELGKIRSNRLVIILWLVTAIGVYSTIGKASVIPLWVRGIQVLVTVSQIIWIWWTINYYGRLNVEYKNFYWRYWQIVLTGLIIIGSVLVVAQGIKGATLGTIVEQSSQIFSHGLGTDEESWLIRPVGYAIHANVMSIILFFEIIGLFLVQLKLKDNRYFVKKWMVLPFLALVWLQSRAMLLSMVVLGGWWWWWQGRFWDWKNIKFYSGWLKLALVVVSIMLGVVLASKIWGTVLNYGKNSGIETRINLVKVARNLIVKNVWWGVGSRNFVLAAYQGDKTGLFRLFPEPVHNGFLLLWAEQGVFGLLLWIVFYLNLMGDIWLRFENRTKWLFLLYLCTISLIAMVQPFGEWLNLPVILAMILLGDDELEKK